VKKFAVIVAGGSGTRMGKEVPKQFLVVAGRPLFLHSIDAFLKAFDDINIVLVMPAAYMHEAQSLLNDGLTGLDSGRVQWVVGGETRFHSVKNGLALVPAGSLVFVHDAVRCLLSATLVERCAEAALQHGSAVPVVPVRDSIRKRTVFDEGSVVVPREELLIVQTPQTFLADLIKAAFHVSYQSSFTDEATVLESYGGKVYLVEGEQQNIKITYPEDLFYAAWKLGVNNG